MNLLLKQIIAHWIVYPVNHFSFLNQADKSPDKSSSLHTLHIQVKFIYIYGKQKFERFTMYNVSIKGLVFVSPVVRAIGPPVPPLFFGVHSSSLSCPQQVLPIF